MADMMRISLQAKCCVPPSFPRSSNIPVSVTIKPANNVPGSFEYQTDSRSLLKLLRQKTDLSGLALERFDSELHTLAQGRLSAVSFRDEVLKEIGYFVD